MNTSERVVTAELPAGIKAAVLCDALPYIRRFAGRIIVAKYGGSAIGEEATSLGRFAESGDDLTRAIRLRSGDAHFPAAVIDVKTAIRFLRAHASDYNLDATRFAAWGVSAGGHLAALSGTQFVPGSPDAEDPIDRASSRPDFLVLGYPWIGAVSSETSPQSQSYCDLFNLMTSCEALRAAYSPDLFVTKNTPPTFWYHTFNDQRVPVEQGLRFYIALVKAGVPTEAHIFANGAHGSGLGKGDASLDQWPALLETWLRAQGLMTPDKPAPKP